MPTFGALAGAGYRDAALPIIPHDAAISAASRNRDALTANRGKVPGQPRADGWVGFHDWQKHVATAEDIARWATWGCGVGLNARRFPAFDVDVDDETLSTLLQSLIQDRLGAATGQRVGRAPRALLPCRADDAIAKRRLEFTIADGPAQAIELLGDGQQYVVAGVHPKTGLPYSWPRPLPPAAALPLLTAAVADDIFLQAAELIELLGGTVKRKATASLAPVAQANLLAPSVELVRQAVECIPNEDEYDDWIAMGAAIKAATGGGGADIWRDWTDSCLRLSPGSADEKWASFRPPFRLGWDYIVSRAAVHGFASAALDFKDDDAPELRMETLLKRFVWVASVNQAFDTLDRKVMNREQFNVANNRVGPPCSSSACAWAKWLQSKAVVTAATITYRPDAPALVQESGQLCANSWRPSLLVPREGDVRPWLDLVEHLLPNTSERELLFDWMAFVAQRPAEKCSWAVLIGGGEGIGKDMMVQPLIHGIGTHNARHISPKDLQSTYTDWAESAKLVIVEEMMSFGRRDVENHLKPLISGLPPVIRINKKFVTPYDIANIAAFLFFTNHEDALHLSSDARRYFVLWSHSARWEPEQYAALARWYERGGYETVMGWLLARDIAAFRPAAPPPNTDARRLMQALSLSPVEAWLRDGIAEGEGPFGPHIVSAAELQPLMRDANGKRELSAERCAVYLRKVGAQLLGRVRLTDGTRCRLWSIRNHEMFASESSAALVRLYEKQRAQVGPTARLLEEAGQP